MKNRKNKKFLAVVFSIGIFFATAFFSIYGTKNALATIDTSISGNPVASTGIIQCGRPSGAGTGQMCTLCDLIAGFNTIIQYIMKIAIGVALLALAVGGVLYIVSAGESAAVETAKSTMKNAAIGFVIVFAAYLIVDTTLLYLGKTESLGMSTSTKWGEFDCNATGK